MHVGGQGTNYDPSSTLLMSLWHLASIVYPHRPIGRARSEHAPDLKADLTYETTQSTDEFLVGCDGTLSL
jgi:hypothetical protein